MLTTKKKTNPGVIVSMLSIVAAGVLPVTSVAQESIDQSVSGQVSAGYESRYFSEGRDALSGDGLVIGSLDVFWDTFAGQIWYAESPDQAYNEIQIQLAVGHSIGDVELYAAYTHLEFPSDDVNDDELSVGWSWSGLPKDMVLSADLVYSFEAAGTFTEVTLARAFDVSDSATVEVSGLFGYNEGYVADGHDGATNLMITVESVFALTQTLEASIFVARSWEFGRDDSLPGDEQLSDFTYGGVGLNWSF